VATRSGKDEGVGVPDGAADAEELTGPDGEPSAVEPPPPVQPANDNTDTAVPIRTIDATRRPRALPVAI
jgi:hypothetical protein